MVPTIKPTPKQHQAWEKWLDPISLFVGFGGGAGGGKSWWISEKRLVRAYQFPGIKAFIGRKELKRLMQSTFITFTKVCAKHQIPESDWRLNGQYNYIEFKNGSRIDLLDLANQPTDPEYERLGSLEYTEGDVDEAGEVPFKAIDVLKSRVGRHLNKEYGILPKTGYTFNPSKSWVYRYFYRPWRDGKLPKEYAFIQSLYNDNEHTAEIYGKQLSEISDPVTRKRLKDGIWELGDEADTLVHYDAIIDLFTNTVNEGLKYMTIDVARFGADRIVISLWRGLLKYRVYIFRKQSIEVTKSKVREIAASERIPFSQIVADEEGVGGGLVDGLDGIKGFVSGSSPLRRKDRPDEAPNYKNLKAQCSYILAEYINSHKIAVRADVVSDFVTPEEYREQLIQEIEQIKRKDPDMDDRKLQVIPKDEVKEAIGRSPDIADTMMMRMYFELDHPYVVDRNTVTRIVDNRRKPYQFN